MPIMSYTMTKTRPVTDEKPNQFLRFMLIVIFLLILFSANSVVTFSIFGKPILVAMLCIYLPFILWNLSANTSTAVSLLTRPYGMLLLWILFFFSFLWSVIPSASLNVVVTLSAFMILIIFITLCHGAEGFFTQLRIAVLMLLTCVAIYSIAVPSSLLLAGGATSFYKQKNNLGLLMGLAILILIFVRGRNIWHILFAGFAVVVLIASRSKTSMAVVLISIALYYLVNWWFNNYYSKNPRGFAWMYPFSVFSLATLVLLRNQFLDLLWNNMTNTMLTGRGVLWLTMIQHSRRSPLLGIGPGTFWKSNDFGGSEISHTILFLTSPDFVQKLVAGDGSYIDLIASIGVLGLALFLYTAVDLYRGLIRNWEKPDAKLMFIVTTFVLFHAITETTILASCNILWMVYVLCYFRVASYGLTPTPLLRKR
jgi:exopolysaccharide production protein ExoQ